MSDEDSRTGARSYPGRVHTSAFTHTCGVALADALDAFAFGAPPPPLLVENCTGFACGADCRPV